VVLIAYGDHLRRRGELPLATLRSFCREHLADLVSTVHVLPFHPSTSYEGYAITDYMAVDPGLGTWGHLAELGEDFDLMMDVVLNHCSASHPWFLQFLADEEPGRRYFVTVEDPDAPWLDEVRRARDLPLLHRFETAAGERNVWTTYSPDLIDLDWREPDVLLEFLEVMLDSVHRGARMLRLDAYGYTWKDPGTPCVARPGTHDLLRLLQAALREAGAGEVAVLPSVTNVTQAENYTFLAESEGARQADLVYHLPLSALLLLGLYEGDAGALREWLRGLPEAPPGTAYFNLAATHDGVGLTWLADLLPEERIRSLVDGARRRGSLLSSRRPTASGEDMPWELNATWFSACAPEGGEDPAEHVARFLATQAVVLALRGVPALYLPLLLAARNDHARVEATGDNRAVNRGRFELAAWEERRRAEGSPEALVLEGMTRLLRARRRSPAFHPEGPQRVHDLGGPGVLALERRAPGDEGQVVLCLVNLSAQEERIPGSRLEELGLEGLDHDLLSEDLGESGETLRLAPYQARWLTRDRGRS
jgi:sucrose phosphorylase